MGKWDYKVKWLVSVDLCEDDLNELGRKGWELVGIYTENGEKYAVFKRPA